MTMLQHGMVSTAGGVDTGDIGHSLRLRKRASGWLSRTSVTPTDSTKVTLSAWVKRGELGAINQVFHAYAGSPIRHGGLRFNTDSTITFIQFLSPSVQIFLTTTAVFRDTSSYYHLFVQIDTTAAVSTDRAKLWVNGQPVSWTGTFPSLNLALQINSSSFTQSIGRFFDSSSTIYADGFFSRLILVDGQALTPDYFGYLDTSINEWITKSQSAIKAVVDAGGSNSFMLDFDDGTSTTTLGYDKSSKGNNWTCNNISLTAGETYDWMDDVPGNSFAVLDTLSAGITTATLSDANMQFTTATTGHSAIGSVGMYSGKWYWEAQTSAGTTQARAAVYGTSASTYYSFAADNTVYGFRFDADAGTLDYTTDGVNYISLATGLTSGPYFPYFNNNGTTSKTIAVNFGQRPFTNTPPAGYKALNQANLSVSGTVVVSGSFTGNANTNGPRVDINGAPKTLTINGNAVTFGTHADKLANGFKLRTSSSSYNASGTNTWTATIDSDSKNIFKYNNAEVNP